jgi:NADPH2:quinone reductase
MYVRKPALPYTPGSDGAGTIEAVGEGVSRVKPGDRVYVAGSVSGTYAELALCAETQVYPLPEQNTFAQGAALGVPYATAYRALFDRGRAQPSETVLVHGATGGVGIACVQLARAAGLTVIGTGGTAEGRRLITAEGAHFALDHGSSSYPEQILKLAASRGVDVIIEMLANKNLGKDLTLLALHGRIVIVGSRGSVEVNPRDAMGRDADICGMTLFNVNDRDLARIHAALGAGLANGTLRPVIGKELPLADARKAHEAVMQPGAQGKIVLAA